MFSVRVRENIFKKGINKKKVYFCNNDPNRTIIFQNPFGSIGQRSPVYILGELSRVFKSGRYFQDHFGERQSFEIESLLNGFSRFWRPVLNRQILPHIPLPKYFPIIEYPPRNYLCIVSITLATET